MGDYIVAGAHQLLPLAQQVGGRVLHRDRLRRRRGGARHRLAAHHQRPGLLQSWSLVALMSCSGGRGGAAACQEPTPAEPNWGLQPRGQQPSAPEQRTGSRLQRCELPPLLLR